jgi:hypothetical protein
MMRRSTCQELISSTFSRQPSQASKPFLFSWRPIAGLVTAPAFAKSCRGRRNICRLFPFISQALGHNKVNGAACPSGVTSHLPAASFWLCSSSQTGACPSCLRSQLAPVSTRQSFAFAPRIDGPRRSFTIPIVQPSRRLPSPRTLQPKGLRLRPSRSFRELPRSARLPRRCYRSRPRRGLRPNRARPSGALRAISQLKAVASCRPVGRRMR